MSGPRAKVDSKRRPARASGASSSTGSNAAAAGATDGSDQQGVQWFSLKLLLMVCLIGADLALNSSLEADSYGHNVDLQFIMFGVHLIVEITIFLTLFLMLCDTYLFQVGLLGVLFAHFKAAFLLQPVYLLFTLFLDGYRISFLMDRTHRLWDLYPLAGFQAMSILHKLVAALYYVVNLRAAMKLADPQFYRKEPWMELYVQLLQQQHHASSLLDSARARLLQAQQARQQQPPQAVLSVQQQQHDSGPPPAVPPAGSLDFSTAAGASLGSSSGSEGRGGGGAAAAAAAAVSAFGAGLRKKPSQQALV